MNEESIKEALTKAAGTEPSAGGAYARFEVARRRTMRIRHLVTTAAGLAAMATIIMVLPGSPFNNAPPADFGPGGQLDPTKRPIHRYEDPKAGFALQYPADWSAAGAPGSLVRFYPPATEAKRPGLTADVVAEPAECLERCVPGEPAMTVEKPHGFFIEVRPIAGSCLPRGDWPCFDPARPDPDYVDELRLAGARTNADSARLGSRPAFRLGASFDGEPNRFTETQGWRDDATATDRVIPRYWCPGCLLTEYVVDWHGSWTLNVRIVAATGKQLETYGYDTTELLSSIVRFRGPAR